MYIVPISQINYFSGKIRVLILSNSLMSYLRISMYERDILEFIHIFCVKTYIIGRTSQYSFIFEILLLLFCKLLLNILTFSSSFVILLQLLLCHTIITQFILHTSLLAYDPVNVIYTQWIVIGVQILKRSQLFLDSVIISSSEEKEATRS